MSVWITDLREIYVPFDTPTSVSKAIVNNSSHRGRVGTPDRVPGVLEAELGLGRSGWPCRTVRAGKHVDFALLTKKTTRIVAAIELNDATHQDESR